MLHTSVNDDMTLEPGEMWVTVDGTAVFPAVLATEPDSDDSIVRPRFRTAIVQRVLDWAEAESRRDDTAWMCPSGDWADEGDTVEVTHHDTDGTSTARYEPDASGRYELTSWPWRLQNPNPAETEAGLVLADLLSYATRFTLDGNVVPPTDLRYNVSRVVHVVRTRTDEWRIENAVGSVYHHPTETWGTAEAFHHAKGAHRRGYHTGRTAAVVNALELLNAGGRSR